MRAAMPPPPFRDPFFDPLGPLPPPPMRDPFMHPRDELFDPMLRERLPPSMRMRDPYGPMFPDLLNRMGPPPPPPPPLPLPRAPLEPAFDRPRPSRPFTPPLERREKEKLLERGYERESELERSLLAAQPSAPLPSERPGKLTGKMTDMEIIVVNRQQK